jgi:hypothetical protein
MGALLAPPLDQRVRPANVYRRQYVLRGAPHASACKWCVFAPSCSGVRGFLPIAPPLHEDDADVCARQLPRELLIASEVPETTDFRDVLPWGDSRGHSPLLC